jgi:hypothetical protein
LIVLLSSFLSSFLLYVCARCCCRQKSVTLHSIYAANRRNRHTHTRLARLRIELYSLQTHRNLFLSSLFIVSFSFVFFLFLSSCVLMCDGGGVCILIYENRSTACVRHAGARDSPFSYSLFLLTARTICSSYLSVRGFAST